MSFFALKNREKKKQWYSRGKTNKSNNKTDLPATFTQSTKSLLERRLSAVSHSTAFRKIKKRTSCDAELFGHDEQQTEMVVADQEFAVEPDYVKIPRSEYEEIKSRVSEIERRISVELQCVGIEDKSIDHTINDVQLVYQKTLVEAEPLSPSTDHIARRLSRELKIRRSSEQKIHRSPSARKIGSLRRRSREREKQNVELRRNRSWHSASSNVIEKVKTPIQAPTEQRRSSFHVTTPQQQFSESTASIISSETSTRTPLDKLRSQNAGLVMEKAKFFDGLTENKKNRTINRRIGAQRNPRLIRIEDKPTNTTKKSLSPQKRKSKSPNTRLRQKIEFDNTEKENIDVGKFSFAGLKETNVKGTPTIKRSLCTRSPRQLYRTPRIETVRVCTPLRVRADF